MKNRYNLNYIFFAHPIKFICETFKAYAKVEGVDHYILDDLEDFEYLVEDLNPSVLVLHEDLWAKHQEGIRKNLDQSKKIPICMIFNSTESPFFEHFPIRIVAPLEPDTLIEQIAAAIESHKNSL